MSDELAPSQIVLRRGDRVLVTLTEEPDPEDAQDYLKQLHESFPGVVFVLAGNVSGLLIQPGDKNPADTPG